MVGLPSGDGVHRSPSNLSSTDRPNAALTDSCSCPSTETANFPDASMCFQVREVFIGQNSTSGGSSDSAANDWHAKPTGFSAASDVAMIVTPVQNCPITCRNVRWSNPASVMLPTYSRRFRRCAPHHRPARRAAGSTERAHGRREAPPIRSP